MKFRERTFFTCSDCGAANQPVKDIADRDRTWWHLNFFEYPCYIHAELPRTNCGNCNRIMRVNVPWALDKPKHYFTLYFDALIIKLTKDMPVNAIGRLVGEHETRLWRILHHNVDNAIASQGLSYVTKISTDEKSAKRGQNYITIFMDPEQRNVIFVTKGRDSGTLDGMQEAVRSPWRQGGKRYGSLFGHVPGVIKGTEENLPDAAITFD